MDELCRVYVTEEDAVCAADSAVAQVLYAVKQALVRQSHFAALSAVDRLSFVVERTTTEVTNG